MSVQNNDILPANEVGGAAMLISEAGCISLAARITGICSAFRYKGVDIMDLETFYNQKVPEILEKRELAKDLHVWQDSEVEQIGLLHKDTVLVFDVEDREDFMSCDIAKHLKTEEGIKVFFDTGNYKLIAAAEHPTQKTYVVEIPEAQFVLRHAEFADWSKRPIWHPRLWLKLIISQADALLGAAVAIPDPKYTGPIERTPLLHFCVPNISSSFGSICFGSTAVSGTTETIGGFAFNIYNQLVRTKFNYDLFGTSSTMRAVQAAAHALGIEVADTGSYTALKTLMQVCEKRENLALVDWPPLHSPGFLLDRWL